MQIQTIQSLRLAVLIALLSLSAARPLVAPPGIVQAQEAGYVFVRQWGSEGSGDGQFNFPRAIAIGPDGNVYVADSDNHRVQVFGPTGTFVRKWGGYGAGPGQFDVPQGIAVDGAGNVYVGDRNNNRVQKFTSEGVFVTAWGSYGSGNGQFIEPRNLAVDGAGNVYVADSFNHRIQKFSSEGAFVAAWGAAGSGEGQFNYATGVAVDAAGAIYVCDADNQRIQKLSPDGAFIGAWGSEGSGPGQFSRPYSAAVDANGDVYVVDEWNQRIQKFAADGTFITLWGSEGSGEGEFNLPHGVAIDRQGLVYVVDEWNHRVQVFRAEGGAPAAPPTQPPETASAPTPPPAATAAPAITGEPGPALLGRRGTTLHFEDFQDNSADGWTLEPDWFIMQDPGGNYVLSGIGPGRARIAGGEWGDVYLSCRVNIHDGSLLVAYRERPNASRYAVRLDEAGVVLSREEATATELGSNETAIPRQTWFDFEMAGEGGRIQVYLDGALQLDVTDPDPLPGGGVGFGGPPVGEVWLDDVTVSDLAAVPVEPPPAATAVVEATPAPAEEAAPSRKLCGSALLLPLFALGAILAPHVSRLKFHTRETGQ